MWLLASSNAWQSTPYTAPLAVTALVFAALGVYTLTNDTIRERVPGAKRAALLLFASAVWIGNYALELARMDLATKLLLNKIQYIGVAPLGVLWFAYVVRFSERGQRFSRRTWAALAVVPGLTLLLAFTNELHGLVWARVAIVERGGFVVLVNHHGLWFYVHTAYLYVLILASFVSLVRTARRTSGLYRRQSLALLGGATAPATAGVLYVTGLNPFPQFNLPVFGFCVTAVVVTWSVFRHRLFTLVPIAWETAVKQMDAGVAVVDADGQILDTNPSMDRYLTVPRSAAVGRPVEETVDVPQSSLRDGEEVETSVRGDGEVRYLRIRVDELAADRRDVGRLVVVRDVTARRLREAELRRQNERLEEFASVVSHDLRNPLGVAQGYTELARETGDPEHFDRVERAHERMESLVEDLLVLAREGQRVSERESVSLESVVRAAWESVRADGVELDVASDRTLEADADRLRSALENLFRNAVEHGDATRIVVEATDEGFRVADDGTGLPDDEAVFERGFTTNESGTGFGLAIVREIVDAHGWRIEVDHGDDVPADGACFAVTLDPSAAHEADADATLEAPPTTDVDTIARESPR